MKLYNKFVLFCVITIMMSILITFVNTKNRTTEQIDMIYYNKITENYFREVDSACNISLLLLDDYENLPVNSFVFQLSTLRASLQKIDMVIKLTSPHYNLKFKQDHRSMNNIAGLFKIYESMLSTWESEILKDISDYQNREVKERFKEELENLNNDLNILKDIDFEQFNLSNSSLYWEDIILSLKSKNVIESYKKAYE